MKIKDITSLIESVAPLETQLGFDNSGMLVGDKDEEVTKVLVTLDVTLEAVDRAIEVGANLIVSHHPIIFYPLHSILADDVTGYILMRAIRAGISIYASHTNFDNARGGLTDSILAEFNVIESSVLDEDGTGRVALIGPTRLSDIVARLRELTGDDTMRVSGDMDRLITKFAIINGAGGRDERLEHTLVEKGVELFVTGEVKHSFALLLKARGIALIDIEHYHAEKIFNEKMSALIGASGARIVIFNDTNPYNS